MESNKLAVLENKLPLKAYVQTDIDEILRTSFMYWLAKLLSLKADKQEIVLDALPDIKYHFHSLGLNEVKKAFEMYARGQLNLEPISNYFDMVLVGKIFKEFNKQKVKEIKVIEPIVISDQEKRNNEILSATICFDYYIQHGYLNDTSMYLYKVLLDKFEFSKQETETLIELSKNIEAPIEEQRMHYRKMCLRRYFDRLHATGKHLKDFI